MLSLTLGLMLAGVLLLAVSGEGASDDLLSSDRRVEWIVGVEGGIPTGRPMWKSVTDTRYGADPTGAQDSSPAFNQALADMPEGHVLFLPAGTYRLDSSLRWQGSNKTLRGAGPGKTRLLFYRGMIELRGTGAGTCSLDVDLSRDAAKGETHVHLASLPEWLKAGHLYIIDELDDPALVRNGGAEGSSHPREAAGNGPRGLGQIVKVTSVRQNGPTDYLVNLEIPLYYGFRVSQQAQLAAAGYDARQGAPLTGCGIEDLYLEGKHALGWSRGFSGHLIRMDNVMNSWVRNIESYNVPENLHVWASFSYRLEVRDSYFHDSHGYDGGEAYGVALYNVSGACLVENNIFRHLHCPTMACYGASGNVFGYNYIFEGAASSRQYPSISTHATHAYMNLWEGNHGVKALADWTHGSSSHNTLFRNRLLGYEAGGVEDQVAVSIEIYNRKWNVLGNVLGTPGYHTIYERANGEPGSAEDRAIYKLGYRANWGCDASAFDDLATMSLLRHGNYDTVTRSAQWEPAIPHHRLPASLYLKAKPVWFGSLPWPAYGPDVENALTNTIPAKVRYEAR